MCRLFTRVLNIKGVPRVCVGGGEGGGGTWG